jgi:hypothetical protein
VTAIPAVRGQRRSRVAQSALSLGVSALVAALAGALAGFVYAHEPARDTLAIDVAPPPAADTATVGGTIASIDGGRVVIDTQSGPVDYSLPADTPIEQLAPLSPADLAAGAAVNVGAERSDTGTIVTGIVVVEARP